MEGLVGKIVTFKVKGGDSTFVRQGVVFSERLTAGEIVVVGASGCHWIGEVERVVIVINPNLRAQRLMELAQSQATGSGEQFALSLPVGS